LVFLRKRNGIMVLTIRTTGPSTARWIVVHWDGLGPQPSRQRLMGAARSHAGRPVTLHKTVPDRHGGGIGYVYRIVPRHVDYPHEPGRMYECEACEAQCHCTPDTTECVYVGAHKEG
jgi:hypothetical protein